MTTEPAQPKSIQKVLAENRPTISPRVQAQLRTDLDRYRNNCGIVRIDLPDSTDAVVGGTVAVIRTDIPGLENRVFGGASPEAVPEKFKGKPGTTGGSVLKAVNPTAVNHAEHVALENLRSAIDSALLSRRLTEEDLVGRRVIMRVEQEPCGSCASGLGDLSKQPGVIRQFSHRYAQLLIEVRSPRSSRSFLLLGGLPQE